MNGFAFAVVIRSTRQIDFVRFLHCNFVLCEYDSMQSKGFSHFAVALSRLNRLRLWPANLTTRAAAAESQTLPRYL